MIVFVLTVVLQSTNEFVDCGYGSMSFSSPMNEFMGSVYIPTTIIPTNEFVFIPTNEFVGYIKLLNERTKLGEFVAQVKYVNLFRIISMTHISNHGNHHTTRHHPAPHDFSHGNINPNRQLYQPANSFAIHRRQYAN
jgi:hypothetical protein